jgi:hypothetical protein
MVNILPEDFVPLVALESSRPRIKGIQLIKKYQILLKVEEMEMLKKYVVSVKNYLLLHGAKEIEKLVRPIAQIS